MTDMNATPGSAAGLSATALSATALSATALSATALSATALSADVVIVGTGVAGALMGAGLAAAGLKVLLLDAGPRFEDQRADAVQRYLKAPVKSGNSPYPDNAYAPHPDESKMGAYAITTGPLAFRGTYTRVVGGTTWHWDGTVARFRPNDFRMRTLFGVGDDWPISYADLDSWYDAAERELGVSGDPVASLFADTRGAKPYPMAAVPMSVLDAFAARATTAAGLTPALFPQARNSVDGYQDRPACCGGGTCNPICPYQAKYDATVHVAMAEAKGARVVDKAVVYELVAGADGRIQGLRYKNPDGTSQDVTGRLFVVAAHAVETAKLLLISRGPATPAGVANRSGMVGRRLMGRVDRTFQGLTPEPVYPYRGPGEIGCVVEGRDGDFRGQYAAFGINWNSYGWRRGLGPVAAAGTAIDQGLRDAALAEAVRRQTEREMVLTAGAEVLPHPDNRVEADFDQRDAIGIPRPRVSFTPDAYTMAGLDQARILQQRILTAMGCTDVTESAVATATGIIAGTTCMGRDPRSSVVDADCRAHDHPNLFIVGSSVLPTASPTPPTLTAGALALRAVATIVADLQKVPG
jgi:choline dehydrogenase-like flavoprotein